jgi:hypothetical protein
MILTGNETDTVHLALVLVFFIAFQSSIGTFYWIYIPELLKINDFCYPMVCLWGTQFLISMTFSFSNGPSGGAYFYITFSLASAIFAALIHIFGIETKGVRWTEIARELLDYSTIRLDTL